MLQYKTKGNVSPQGKRRVYFTCHPDDYDRFFDRISTDILKFSDSAIWFNPDDNYEDIDTDLGQMNLFVIPITTKLLTKPCRTMQLDVPFALEKHIPILPLMQEGGLDELFTRYFGDLQYLDPNTHDITAISYEEKLKKYLNSVLVSDEMAEKVRAAFDAYIFLSYRKKDRKYANELMRLIHKNDFCRDIAIWYDEFLVPGEDFNDAISHALKKSDLFTMVVTPNLINEKNYVQTVEYPEAVKQNKIIIPTELEKTDYKSLSEKYPNIPNSINAHDKNALSDALQTALINIARRENDNDPQHSFFIGLAYLEGIDVEVDHDRALQLITSAAETNEVPEAIEKLVAMYKEGYGVKRDYLVAVQWQQKLVEYWEREYEKSNLINSYEYLFNVLLELGDSYLLLNNIFEAENVYFKAVTLVEKFTNTFPQLTVINEYVPNIERMLNYLKEEIDIPKQISTYVQTKFWNKLHICFNKLGYLFQEKGNLEQAFVYFKKSLDMQNQLLCNNGISTSQDFMASTCDNIGNLYESQWNLDKAEKYYLKSFKWRKFKADHGLILQNDDNAWLELTSSYINLGDIYKKRELLDIAENYYRSALLICEQRISSIENYYYLSIIYGDLGEIFKNRGNLDVSEAYFFNAIEIITQEQDSISKTCNLASNYDKLGDLYTEWAYWDKAGEFYNKALILRETFVGCGVYVNDIRYSYNKFGYLYLKLGQYDKAEGFFLKSLLLTEQLMKKKNKMSYYHEISCTYANIANVFHLRCTKELFSIMEGNYKFGYFWKIIYNFNKSIKYYKKSLSINNQLYEKTKSFNYQLLILSNLNSIGSLYLSSLKLNKARGYLHEALKIGKLFTEETTNKEKNNYLLSIYISLCSLYRQKRNHKKSKEYSQYAIELTNKLVRETGLSNINQVIFYATSYYSIAINQDPCDFLLLKKSLELYSIVDTQYPGFTQYSKIIDDIKNTIQENEH